MRKYIAVLLIFTLGLGMILLSGGIKNNPEKISEGVASLKNDCVPGSPRCRFVAPMVTEAETITYALKRKSISKDELPIMRVYMSDGSIGKLQDKRRSVLSKPQPIHISHKEDWVSGEVIVEFENRKEKSKVNMRLKGDWADHLIFPRKLSLRMKTRGGGYLFGMKTLSVQHPLTRGYGMGPLILEHMKRHDILAPRQRFVDLYVNDIPVGIMSMEEHFAKEMIEAQDRRDGPLLAIDEDPLWAQWDINHNITQIAPPESGNFFGYRDGTIKDFNGSRYAPGSIATQNRKRGEGLLRDFLEGNATAGTTFDYERMSTFWVLTNIWGGCHGLIWHNRRFYFNPISGLLEPLSFDNNANPYKAELCVDADIEAAFQDPAFRASVDQAIDKIREEITSDEFAGFLETRQTDYQKAFTLEHFSEIRGKLSHKVVVNPQDLQTNLDKLEAEINTSYENGGSVTGADKRNFFGHAEPDGILRSVQGVVNADFLAKQDHLATHLTAMYFPSTDGGMLALRNLTGADIEITNLTLKTKGTPVRDVQIPKTVLAGQNKDPRRIEIPLDISDDTLAALKSFDLEFTYKGISHTRPVDIQFKSNPSGFVDKSLAYIRKIAPTADFNDAVKVIIFNKGVYDFDQSAELPRDWSIVLMPGTIFNFKDGALLKINGRFTAEGMAADPIIVNVESNETYGDMGKWGGILVSKAKGLSRVSHFKLMGTGTQNLKTRQGYFGMTGCLSFYESDVDIKNVEFIDAQCEDALNIVKADFTIENMLIDGARADAFDSDFSVGTIKNSRFVASGNDGVDVSGTQLTLQNITMEQIGDKAVSVGEKSTLNAREIKIDGAVLGLVSKDLSKAEALYVEFENIRGTALMTYIKKAEYGPSQINCDRCMFKGNFEKTGKQDGTSITLNGETITTTRLSRQQMLDAGLLVEEISQ
jgi:hypothetical protein